MTRPARKNLLRFPLAVALLALASGTGRAQDDLYSRFQPRDKAVKRTVWVDASESNLNDVSFRTTLCDLEIDRIIVTVFLNGETLFPCKSGLFYQMEHYRDADDGLAALLAEARRK